MKKVYWVVVILIVFTFVLSSCGSKQQEAVELKFDDKLTWSSTYDDIINNYGQPFNEAPMNYNDDSVYKNDNVKAITFEFNCCGYTDYGLSLIYNLSRSRLTNIFVVKDSKDLDECKKEFDGILSALKSKYGTPIKGNDDKSDPTEYIEFYRWETLKETKLCFYLKKRDGDYYRIGISYINTTAQNILQ